MFLSFTFLNASILIANMEKKNKHTNPTTKNETNETTTTIILVVVVLQLRVLVVPELIFSVEVGDKEIIKHLDLVYVPAWEVTVLIK